MREMGAQEEIRDLVTAMDGKEGERDLRSEEEEEVEERSEGVEMTAAGLPIPRSPISIDISLPLPRMKPHIV